MPGLLIRTLLEDGIPEGFLSTVQLLIGVAGYEFLRSREVSASGHPQTERRGEVFEYRCKGALAKMIRRETGYVVLGGSTARADSRKSAIRPSSGWIHRLRNELIQAGILVAEGTDLYRFTKDAEFASPTAAAVVVAGGEANGRIVWKLVANGKTLKELEASEVQGA